MGRMMLDTAGRWVFGMGKGLPGYSIPSDIGQVEDQVLRSVIHWSTQHLGPVLQVCPSLVRRMT